MLKIFLFVVIILLDQLTKQFALTELLPSLGDFLVTPICNPFISWGIPLVGIWFWLVWIGAIGTLFTTVFKSNYDIFLLIILAGAISNLIDRVQLNCVIDFIKLGNFPIFNLADVAIILGVLLFIGKIIYFHKKASS